MYNSQEVTQWVELTKGLIEVFAMQIECIDAPLSIPNFPRIFNEYVQGRSQKACYIDPVVVEKLQQNDLYWLFISSYELQLVLTRKSPHEYFFKDRVTGAQFKIFKNNKNS